MNKYEQAADILQQSSHTTAFTGAGISVESGIPPFRGENGLWSKYDPQVLDINYFYAHPEQSWELNKKIFYDIFKQAQPNQAHKVLARMEDEGLVQAVVTQNIDNLHQEAGSENIYEFHGNSRKTVCIECGRKYDFREEMLAELPPRCEQCGGVLKPDFIFFGEAIPEPAGSLSFAEAEKAEVFLVVGTTGEIQPASLIPFEASKNGARVLEINTAPSNYTGEITDIFLQGKATEVMQQLADSLDI